MGKRGTNFTEQELVDLMQTIFDVAPQDSFEWDRVCEIHKERYPDVNRNTDSIRRKFNALHRLKAPTGDPKCPPYVKLAKRAHREIGDRALLTTGQENQDQLMLEDIPANGTTSGDNGNNVNAGDSNNAGGSNVDSSGDEDDSDDDPLLNGDGSVDGSNRSNNSNQGGNNNNNNNNNNQAAGSNNNNQAANQAPAPAANGQRSRDDTSTIAIPRRSPPSRSRSNSNMAENVVQMMMMDMQQRQLEHQERMAQMERERIDQLNASNANRTLMATALQNLALAFIQRGNAVNNT